MEPLVVGVSGNIHESFSARYEAERAYTLAYALGAVHWVQRSGNLALPGPPPALFMAALQNVDDDFLSESWHVVYKSKQPGMYPSW